MVKVYPRFECVDENLRNYVNYLEDRINVLEEKLRDNNITLSVLIQWCENLEKKITNEPETPPILSDLELESD